VLQGPYEPLKYPAQIGAVGATWFIDIAAGALLDTAKESA
jgi:hypothetical protein